jgi:hypothetical protein
VKNSKKRILLPPAAKQRKSVADFAPRTAQMNLIVFCRGVYVAKNTLRGASVRACGVCAERSAILLKNGNRNGCRF